MKKILGLDIGTTSIGWAVVGATEEKKVNEKGETAVTDINNDRIGIYEDAVGVRIIPQDSDNIKSFTEGKKLNTGNTLTPTAKRRVKRGGRRMKSRYKLRRDKLCSVLDLLGMLPDASFQKVFNRNEKPIWKPIEDKNSTWYTKKREYEFDEIGKKKKKRPEGDIGEQLYKLRTNAPDESKNIALKDWGRILLHLNQWRGYSSDRFRKDDKPAKEYYTVQIAEFDVNYFEPIYDKKDKEKKEPLYNKYQITLTSEEGMEIQENEEKKIVFKLSGTVYYKNPDIKQGDFITIKNISGGKSEKKITTDYGNFTITNPDADDWDFNRQKLNKSLKEWCETGGTVGSYFYQQLYIDKELERIRNNVVNREWYEYEFEKIWAVQYPKYKNEIEKISIDEILRATFKDKSVINEVKAKSSFEEQLKFLIKDKIIYYQRPWQQAKNKGECRFEKILKRDKEGNIIYKEDKKTGKKRPDIVGRPVIPRSHPLFQKYKVWQQVNNVRIWYHPTDDKPVELLSNSETCNEHLNMKPEEVKNLLYLKLQEKEKLSWRTFVNETFNLNVVINKNDKRRQAKYEAYFSVNFIKKNKKGEEQDNLLKGNTTKWAIKNVLADYFKKEKILVTEKQEGKAKEIVIEDKTNEWFEKKHPVSNLQIVTNLQLLWELIYDVTERKPEKVAENITKHFPELKDYAVELAKIQFKDSGMASLSAKAIRNLLPLMRNGVNLTEKAKSKIQTLIALNNSKEENEKEESERLECLKDFISDKNSRIKLSQFKSDSDFRYLNYWEATSVVYGSHSAQKIQPVEKLERIKIHSLNNPVVEKVVNETLMLVNEIKERYGFDEVRIELARELKAGRDEREQMWEGMNKNNERNEWAKAMLRELKYETSLNNYDKVKIYQDVSHRLHEEEFKKKKFDFKEPTQKEIERYLHWVDQKYQCPYTGEVLSLTDALTPGVCDVDHIIPQARYLDNSYTNKVLCRKYVNKDLKKNLLPSEMIGIFTEKDGHKNRRPSDDRVKDDSGSYVKKNGKEVQLLNPEDFITKVNELFPKGRKLNNLLRREIPDEPLNRDLKDTQYISKKLKEEIEKLCPGKVWTTTGKVTDLLREKWNLNDVMKELMRERFKNFNVSITKGETEKVSLITPETIDKESGEIKPEKFEGYSKRLDHRHHALDAIIIACTKQQHIQYINTLNAQFESENYENEDEKVKEEKKKYKKLKEAIYYIDTIKGKNKKVFYTPWDRNTFIRQVRAALENVIISHKNVRLLISPSKHRNKKVNIKQKTASLRGQLHDETNYAKRNYLPEKRQETQIENIVSELLIRKYENQNQTMIGKRSFADLIKGYVFKEKYQKELIQVFEKYDNVTLNNKNRKQADENTILVIQKNILEVITLHKLLFNHKENKSLEWLTTFTEKNSSARPMGLEFDFNFSGVKKEKIKKKIEDIADPRIKRLAKYRLEYVNQKLNEIDELDLDKKEKDERKAKVKAIKLYTNAIYEVRIKNNGNYYEWIELNKITPDFFERIEYARAKHTKAVKEKIQQIWQDRNNSLGDYFAEPIHIAEKLIPVKKVRLLAWADDLFEIKPKKYVNPTDSFMAYIFELKKDAQIDNSKQKKREIRVLKFIEAISILNQEKPDKIKYAELMPNPDRDSYELAFTISRNDLVYLSDKEMTQEEIEAIDWNDIEAISQHLHIVKDINPSQPGRYFVFQKHTQADEITISEKDAKFVFENPEMKEKEQKEIEKFGSSFTRDNCIKVFTDKLGKKVVPYWEFPNGSWNKERAKDLGLI